jgi:hypothetical protein
MGFALFAALTLASCGNSQPSVKASPASGILGIVVIGHGGMQPSPPTLSLLLGGFGLSEAMPYPKTTVVVRATSGSTTGAVVAQVRTNA